METKIILIALAVFSISILLAYDNQEALAQLTFTVTSITYTGNTNYQSNCQYIDSSEVWCTSTSGVKIINPTSQTISQTLFSGITIQDIECSALYCYSWHNGDTSTANMTQWNIETHDINNSTTFTMGGGTAVGRQIEVVSAQGAENILVPSSQNSCTALGSTTLKGVCIFDGTEGFFNSSRFISSGDSGASAVVFNIKWSETLNTIAEPTLNNALVFFQDGAGIKTWRIINLNDADTTFTLTQTCVSGSIPSLGATATFQVFVYDETYYVPIDNGATGYYAQLPIRSTTCTSSVTYPTTWDGAVSLMTDGEFFYTASFDSVTSKSAMQVYNSTSSALATYNTTNTSAPALPVKNGWYHSTEGEIQILGNSRLIIFTVAEPSGGSEFCEQPENFNILRCVLERGDTTPLMGASEQIDESATNIICQIGLVACTQDADGNFTPVDDNIQTNGIGYIILVVALGILIGIFWVASRGDLGSIPTFLWFIATLAVVGTITAFDFIDPTFLVIAIIAIIALAVAKTKGLFGSSALFTGET